MYLKEKIVEISAVWSEKDVWIDQMGNLVWTVSDPDDGIAPDSKKVVCVCEEDCRTTHS